MIEVSVTINKPLKEVWRFFIEPSNWKKWRGGFGLKRVSPGWEKGAHLEWELGGYSTILEYIPERLVAVQGTWAVTTYAFEKAGENAVNLTYNMSDPSGGASFTDGGAAETQKVNKYLQEFKRMVEG
jgi:uncharacterized protein YndB with AHSA1/START domain